MGIKIVTHDTTVSMTKHGELITSITSEEGLSEAVVSMLVKTAYQRGRDDMKYEFELALSQLRSSD